MAGGQTAHTDRLEELYSVLAEAEDRFRQYVREMADGGARSASLEQVIAVTRDLHGINQEITRLRR